MIFGIVDMGKGGQPGDVQQQVPWLLLASCQTCDILKRRTSKCRTDYGCQAEHKTFGRMISVLVILSKS